MKLLLGQAINARDVEEETSGWTGARFANLCDSLIWAEAGRLRTGPPSLDQNILAPDGGIDAECFVDLEEELGPSPLMGRGWNVFQYKKRDTHASPRSRVVSELKKTLKGALADVSSRNDGRRVDRYVVCVNVNLSHRQKQMLHEAILEGWENRDETGVAVLGAQELAQFLNDRVHLRAAFFRQRSFRTWLKAFEDLRSRKPMSDELYGRDELCSRATTLLQDSRIRVVVISGPHDMGKTHLALEVTRNRMDSVVVAVDPLSLDAGDLRALASPDRECLCIVEDPDPKLIDALTHEALVDSGLKLLMTVPSPSLVPRPSYGTDDRVQFIEVPPLSADSSAKLLEHVAPDVPFATRDWIVERSGGVPGILLAAAAVHQQLRVRSGAAEFAMSVGEEHVRRIKDRFGSDAVTATKLVSLLIHTGIAGQAAPEARLVAELFGDGMSLERFVAETERLSQAGILQRRGQLVKVTIPLVANYLAQQAVRIRKTEICELYARLPDDAGRERLLRRLAQLDTRVIGGFWDLFFQVPSKSAAEWIGERVIALPWLATAVPDRTFIALQEALGKTTIEERCRISGDWRRAIVSALEQLLFRRATAQDTLRLLGCLAEAETEDYGNNATGLFAGCFHPLHPQVPLELDTRLRILREFVASRRPESCRVAWRAIDAGMPGGAVFSILRSSGSMCPFDAPVVSTYGEIWNYLEALLELAWELADGKGPVGTEIRLKLAGLVNRFGCQAVPSPRALIWLERLVKMVVQGESTPSVSDVSDAVRRVLSRTEESLEDPEFLPKHRNEWESARKALGALNRQLDNASLGIRLRRTLGRWHDEEDDTDIAVLAEEVLSDPAKLVEADWEWLLSAEARRGASFFTALGEKDVEAAVQDRIETAGKSLEGAQAFASYVGGWAGRDPRAAEQRIEDLAREDALDGSAVVLSTARLKANSRGVARLVDQLERDRVTSGFVARVIQCGGWMKPLKAKQILPLLREIAGADLAGGADVLDVLHMWLYSRKQIRGELQELVWEILEADPPIGNNEDRNFDHVAADIAGRDPDRAFRLLERLLATSRQGKWEVVQSHGRSEFWRALCAADKVRALETAAGIAADSAARIHLVWALKGQLTSSEDRHEILSVASGSVEMATFLAGCLRFDAQGFWHLAGELMSLHPESDPLWHAIAGAIEGLNEVTSGPYSEFLEGRRKEVRRALESEQISAPLRRRLQEWMERVKDKIERNVAWDYDVDVADIVRDRGNRESIQRIWAIGRILKYASMEEIRRLLTVQDVEDALEQVDLPEKRRHMFEAALEVWKRDG